MLGLSQDFQEPSDPMTSRIIDLSIFDVACQLFAQYLANFIEPDDGRRLECLLNLRPPHATYAPISAVVLLADVSTTISTNCVWPSASFASAVSMST
jgi:hypothetical protein